MLPYIAWAISFVLACVSSACALHWRTRLLYERDDHELALIAARTPGRDLEHAIWDRLGKERFEELDERARTGPWAGGPTTLLISGRLVGFAWRDHWRHANEKERAEHDALQHRGVLSIDVTPGKRS